MLEAEETRKDTERRAVVSRRTVVRRVAGADGTGTGTGQGKKKVSFAMADPGAPSVGRAPSAAEYIPPANFLKQMTEPGKSGGMGDPFAALWSGGGGQ